MNHKVRLGDLIRVRHGFAFGGEHFKDQPPGDVLVTPGNFRIGGGFNATKFKYYQGPEIPGFVLEPGDLIVTMTDLSRNTETLGFPAIVPTPSAGHRYLHNQRIGRVELNGEALDRRYLYYVMCSREYRSEILASATGTTVKHTAPARIEAFTFDLPSLVEQRRIGDILGALDDKIELNGNMLKTLEAIARAVFTSWFVDFDPVRAKSEGGETGLPGEIAALFPDSFVNSPGSKMPEGWMFQPLSSLCSLIERGVTPKYQSGSGKFIVNQKTNRGLTLDLTALKELSPDLIVPLEKTTHEWDILVNCLGEGTLGRTHLFRGNTVYAVDQHMAICRASSHGIAPLVYQYLESTEGQSTIEALKTGSTGMTMLNVSKLRAIPMLWPGTRVANAYGRIVSPIWHRIAVNEQMSRTLASLRNTLLPKLMSGDFKVSEAESALEKSA